MSACQAFQEILRHQAGYIHSIVALGAFGASRPASLQKPCLAYEGFQLPMSKSSSQVDAQRQAQSCTFCTQGSQMPPDFLPSACWSTRESDCGLWHLAHLKHLGRLLQMMSTWQPISLRDQQHVSYCLSSMAVSSLTLCLSISFSCISSSLCKVDLSTIIGYACCALQLHTWLSADQLLLLQFDLTTLEADTQECPL